MGPLRPNPEVDVAQTEVWLREVDRQPGAGEFRRLLDRLGFEDRDDGWTWLARAVTRAASRGRDVGARVRVQSRHLSPGRLIQIEDEAAVIQGMLTVAIAFELHDQGADAGEL